MKAITLALAAIATSVLAGGVPTTVSADALPSGYPAYVDLNTFLGQFGDINVSGVIIADTVTTGDDSNGGFLERSTVWAGPGGSALFVASAADPTHPFGLGAPYFASGYVNAGLPFRLNPDNAILTNAPPASSPPVKDQDTIDTYNLASGALGALSGELLNPGLDVFCGPTCLGLSLAAFGLSQYYSSLAADPADPNYGVIATPDPPPALTAPDYPGLTSGEISAWADLTSALSDLSSVAPPIGTSFNRAQGAFEGGAPQFWVDLQLEAMEGYDQLANADLSRIEADAAVLGLGTSTPASVPEPGTLVLLGGALLGLGTVRIGYRKARFTA